MALATFALLVLAADLAIDVPPGKETLVIHLIPGKLDPVKFAHAEHAHNRHLADGTPLRCKNCHHMLPDGEEKPPLSLMRCEACHVGIGETPKVIEGKTAAPLAGLKPDGAIDFRTILFHKYCLDCHRKLQEQVNKKLSVCKTCHEHGLPSSAIHGRYDSFPQEGSEREWLKCPVGQQLAAANRCAQTASALNFQQASQACPQGYRLPTRAEVLGLLQCDKGAAGKSKCRPCGESGACADLFGADAESYWTSETGGEKAVAVSLKDGSAQAIAKTAQALVRCVK